MRIQKRRGRVLRLIALISAFVFVGCNASEEKPQSTTTETIEVSGEIIFVQESMGWSTPIHTVIKNEDGEAIRVYGQWGRVGDSVTVNATPYGG